MHIRWRGLELPSQVTCDTETLTGNYGKFFAEPFERGFGTTIGNGLRRILLSSLEGSAVTQIKVHNAQHEFTSIPGVLEDVTDITAGVVTAADIETDESVEVINKDIVIATLTEDVPFVIEMVVENGRGYSPSTEHGADIQEVGIIPVDAVFSPITRVRYGIEETRVGQKTNYDRLTIEIQTDGSVNPEMALVEASKILRKHLTPFVQYTEIGPQVHSASRGGIMSNADSALETKLNMNISEMNLSVRAGNCLETENLLQVRDLVTRTEDQLLEVRNFGETTLAEVQQKLRELGLHLGMRVPGPTATV